MDSDRRAFSIPSKDYRRQYEPLLEEVLGAFRRVLLEEDPILGAELERFEAEFAAYLGVRHVVGLNSGTDALVLGMRALGLRPGDEVITQANTFFATVTAIEMAGARPVLADCRRGGPEIDLDQVERALTSRTRAVIVVHLHGFATPLRRLRDLCAGRGLLLIEDAAQAHGACVEDGRRAGSVGVIGAFSFHPSKNLGAFGDGGAVATEDDGIAAALRVLRNLGKSGKHELARVGPNSKLDTLQAALLRVKLRRLEEWNARRRELARAYDAQLAGLPGLELPAPLPGTEPVYHHYPVLARQRDPLVQHLAARGIKTSLHYPVPPHLQPGLAHLGYGPGSFPEAERRAAEEISLPLGHELRLDEVAAVSAAVRAFATGTRGLVRT